MKYICLGYLNAATWDSMSDAERARTLEACFAYDDVLREGGHFVGGEALQGSGTAVTLRQRHGEVAITDGPYAETREQLGGILVLEARDLNHAIALMARHPGLRMGPFEIRPAADLVALVAASRARRAATP
jgi:hypothetical protein